MARQTPLVAQLIADLFVAVEQDDPLTTLETTQALAERIGAQAAITITRALLAEHRQLPLPATFPPPTDQSVPLVSCA